MFLPEEYLTADAQIVDFNKSAIIALKLKIITTGKNIFVYPLFLAQPLEKIKFFNNELLRHEDYVLNFSEKAIKENAKILLDDLTYWTFIERCMLQKLEGLILYYNTYRFFMPIDEAEVASRYKNLPYSLKRMSFAFSRSSILQEFEKDRAVVLILMKAMWYFKTNKINVNILVDEELFILVYNRIIETVEITGGQITFENLLDDKNTLYVLNDEMETKLNYLQSLDNLRVYLDKFTPRLHNVSLLTSRRFPEYTIRTFIDTNQNHQCFTFNRCVFVCKKFDTKSQAIDWLNYDRLQHIKSMTHFSRNEDSTRMTVYPNVKHQRIVSIYNSLKDYENLWIEDIDGYKPCIILHENVYGLIPIFVPYKSRTITNITEEKNILSMSVDETGICYWNLNNEVVFSNGSKYTHNTTIADVTRVRSYFILLDITNRIFKVFVEDKQAPKVIHDNVMKVVSRKNHICILTLGGDIKQANLDEFEREQEGDLLENILKDVIDMWVVHDLVIAKLKKELYIWGSHDISTSLEPKIFDAVHFGSNVETCEWKNFTGNTEHVFGLANNVVYLFGISTTKIIDFPMPIIQIRASTDNLFAWNKTKVFEWKNGKIKSKKNEICDIIDHNHILTLETSS